MDKYCEKLKEKVKSAPKMLTFKLYSSVIKNTPVAEEGGGRARGNWNISTGSPDLSTDDSKTEQQYNKYSDLPKANGDDAYFIANNLPYISVLEYGGYPNPVKKGSWSKKDHAYVIKSAGGYSKQAPQGMVGLTVAKFKKLSDEVAEELRSQK